VSVPLALFVCRLNIATSIMAEAILRQLAGERLQAASAGEIVRQPVSRRALRCLSDHGIGTAGLRSKPWGEFFGLGRRPVRFVIALCEVYATNAAWPAGTLISRWPMSDPATAVGTELDIRNAFEATFVILHARVQRFLALPIDQLDDGILTSELARIGEQR
jgi:protein-tyrosine-phosphatase